MPPPATSAPAATPLATRPVKNYSGKYNFNIPGNPTASIVNLGHITATSGGFAALVAPGVRNSGTITATLGTVSLAAGNAYTLDFYGDKLITLAVNDQIASKVVDAQTGKPLTSLVGNDGALKADGGRVELTAAAARVVVDSVINNKGVIEANTVGTRNGMIVLSAATGASKPAGAPTQTVKLSGSISAAGKAKGTTGGTVVVTGENIQLTGAKIDASGDAGGGHVLIGGDTGGGHPSGAAAAIELAKLENFAIPTATTVSVDAGTTINASATGIGNGGKVVLWSDQQTTFAGTILAQGGAAGGNGGFVETSSHSVDFTGAQVSTVAPNGATGTWLVDPTDLTVDSIAAGTISSNLASTNVLVQTNADGTTSGAGTTSSGPGDIIVAADISWSSNNTLTLSAYHDIQIGVTDSKFATISNTGAGNLVLRADNSGTGSGTVKFPNGQVDFSGSAGAVSIYYNPSTPGNCGAFCYKYQNATDFTPYVLTNGTIDNQLTAYMLVNNASDLALVTNVGTYALGRNIDATGFPGTGYAPPLEFSGLFDGNGGLGVNYTISNLSLAPLIGGPFEESPIGLFPLLTGTVRNLNFANVSVSGENTVGTVAGMNAGTISNVAVLSGSVNGLSSSLSIWAGGLVGYNAPPGLITGSSANATVAIGDSGGLASAGGLVGKNLGSITTSSASGNVSGGVEANVGGLAGFNSGSITASSATGNVSGGTNSFAGGLVGWLAGGSVTNSFATGTVGGGGSVGGLVGGAFIGNSIISSSYATGNVTGGANADVGGLLGGGGGEPNSGNLTLVISSHASGKVVGGDGSSVGGLSGAGGQISSSYATGNVSGGANAWVGGLIGTGGTVVSSSYATGNVTAGDNSGVGGLVGENGLANQTGAGHVITTSFATGNVTGGNNSFAGGLVGLGFGTLSQVYATGSVTAASNSSVGGLVGMNVAGAKRTSDTTVFTIQYAYATGSVSGGVGSYVGGLIGQNVGPVDQAYATGEVSGGSGGTLGGLIAVDHFAFATTPTIFGGFTFPTAPGSVTNLYWNTNTSGQQTSAGGNGMTSQQLASGLPPGFDPTVWTIQSDPSFPYFPWQPATTIPSVVLRPTTPSNPNPPPEQQIISNASGNLTLVSLPPAVNVLPFPPPPAVPGTRSGAGPGPAPGGPGAPPPQFGPRFFVAPPVGETRFVKDEVVLQIPFNIPLAQLQPILARLGLTILESQSLDLLGVTTYRVHIGNGSSLATVIRALAAYQIIAGAQANYAYQLVQAQEEPANLAGRTQEGDAARYALSKLGLFDIHRQIKGSNVPIAVIDSEIDTHHPDLDGVFAGQFDAVGHEDAPHPHGTGMAGAIAAHRRLMGIAPAARIYAVHAFSSGRATAESTTFSILKGIDWSVSKGVRVINMSFAGPNDPSLERVLKNAHDKGVVLIAAAGNAGPKSPPLFPGADPNVIAVTATDVNDKLFNGANRGKYIAVAAPGVDILVPAPANTYQLTTGTSVSSAEVSGIAALLLERNPNLTPEDIRKILTTSAKHPGDKPRDDDYGSGLVDPPKAVETAGELPAASITGSLSRPKENARPSR